MIGSKEEAGGGGRGLFIHALFESCFCYSYITTFNHVASVNPVSLHSRTAGGPEEPWGGTASILKTENSITYTILFSASDKN